MKTNKIKFWARLGQVAYFITLFSSVFFDMQLPGYVPIEYSGTITEKIFCMIEFIGMVAVSEAAVRLIIYFAELLEKRK